MQDFDADGDLYDDDLYYDEEDDYGDEEYYDEEEDNEFEYPSPFHKYDSMMSHQAIHDEAEYQQFAEGAQFW